jgi:DNA (cytosine-5)-methyltransferase 1
MLVSVGNKHRYPDMKLYEEIVFLQQFFKGIYVVENVIPYYEPLIKAVELDRHLFWSNIKILSKESKRLNVCGGRDNAKVKDLEKEYGYDLSGFKLENKLKTLRNCVHPETGLHILNCARGIITRNKNTQQQQLFNL